MYWWVFTKKKAGKLFNSELFLFRTHLILHLWCCKPLRMLRRVSHGAEDKLYGSLQAQGAVCCLASRSGGRQEKGTMVVFESSNWQETKGFSTLDLGAQFFLIGWWCGNNSWQLKSVRPCSIGVRLWRRQCEIDSCRSMCCVDRWK